MTEKSGRKNLSVSWLESDVERLSAIIHAQQEIATSDAPLDQVMSLIVDHAQVLTVSDGATIEMAEGDHMILRSGCGLAKNHIGLRIPSNSLSRTCLRKAKSQFCSDTEVDERIETPIALRIGFRSAILVPLKDRGKAVAVLRVFWIKPNAFDHRHIDTLELVSDMMGGTLNRSRINYQREVFAGMMVSLATADTLERIAKLARNVTSRLWEWDAFLFSIRRSGHDRFRTVLAIDDIDGDKKEFPPFEYDAGIYSNLSALLEGETVLINRKVPPSKPAPAMFGNVARPSASLLYAPLKLHSEITAILSVQSYTPKFFTESDRKQLQRIAEVLAPAVWRSRAERRMAAFADLGQKLSSAANPVDVAQVIADVADDLVGWDACTVQRLAEDSSRLITILVIDTIDGSRVVQPSKPSGGPPGALSQRTIHEGAQLILRGDEETFVSGLTPFGDTGRRSASMVFVPIRTGTQVVGIMSIQSYSRNAYNQEDVKTLQGLADHCGGALERTHVEEELRQSEASIRASEAELFGLFSAMTDFIFVLNRKGDYIRVAPTSPALMTDSFTKVVGRNIRSVFPSPLGDELLDVIERTVQSGETASVEYTLGFGDARRWYHANISRVPDDRVIWVARDITDLRKTLLALEESEERYALAVRGANDGLWDWNLKSGEIYLSPRWKSMLGYEDNELDSSLQSWFGRVHPDDIQKLRNDIDAHLLGNAPHFENEHRIQHRDGQYRWWLTRGICVRSEDGKALRMAGSQSDITVRKNAEQELTRGAFHDVLTGLPNRAYFIECLVRSMSLAKRRQGYKFSILFLDLDRFKVINDSLGHMVGDQFLIAVARRLEQCLRPGDVVARIGGDEFTILLDDINDTLDATLVSDRIQDEVAKPINVGHHEMYSSVSIGIAFNGPQYVLPEDLLRDADIAMYEAKSLGKARYQIFDKAMHQKAVSLLQVETDLRRALENEEFELYYQPIYSLQNSAVSGFEALIRWNHPERGLVSPGDFVPVAEESGLIIPIGFWVLREAARQAREWHDICSPNQCVPISVNLSGRQFAHPQLIGEIRHIIETTGIPPYSLSVEITESVVMENPESFVTVLGELKKLNIRLHIDDFGTGYSSLSYLHRFPIDVLKIDRSFIHPLVEKDGQDVEIVRGIIALAHSLGMGVVAEGVETVAQADQLTRIGCECAQGYHFARPMTASQAAQYVLEVKSGKQAPAC